MTPEQRREAEVLWAENAKLRADRERQDAAETLRVSEERRAKIEAMLAPHDISLYEFEEWVREIK